MCSETCATIAAAVRLRGRAAWPVPVLAVMVAWGIGACTNDCRATEPAVERSVPASFENDLGLLLDREPGLWIHLQPRVLREANLLGPLVAALDPLPAADAPSDFEELLLGFRLTEPQRPTVIGRGAFPRDRVLATVRGRPGTGGWVHETVGRSSVFRDPLSGQAMSTPAGNLLLQGEPDRVRGMVTRLEDLRDGRSLPPAAWLAVDAPFVARIQVTDPVRRTFTSRLDHPAAPLLLGMIEGLSMRVAPGGSGLPPSVVLEIDATGDATAELIVQRLEAARSEVDAPEWMLRMDGVERSGSRVRVLVGMTAIEVQRGAEGLARLLQEDGTVNRGAGEEQP